MGQYYLVANIDKKEYMISPDFVKLMNGHITITI